MSADDVSMNAADDRAVNFGGDGSAFVPIAEPTDTIIGETKPYVVDVAPRLVAYAATFVQVLE